MRTIAPRMRVLYSIVRKLHNTSFGGSIDEVEDSEESGKDSKKAPN